MAGIIAKPLPIGAVALFGVAARALTGTPSIQDARSGFSVPAVWLTGLPHFANGPAPVAFGTSDVSMGAWWGIGGAVSVINILIRVGVNSVW